jgi:polysaccharide pyruvyl transferase WcaK-like protein
LLPGFALTAYALGREIVLLGIGIDRRPTGSVAALARRATRVVVRDRRSVDLFAEADVRAELAPDLSTLMPSIGRASGRRALRAVGVDPTRRILGLCLTSMHGELDAGLQAAVLALVDARPDLQPLLIPMSRHPFVAAHDDERLARRLAERRPTLRVLDTDDPATILSVFATLDVALCMRYHALQFADRAGVPIVAIPYAPKCDAWLAERGLAATPANAEALTLALDAIVPRPADRAIREGAAA